MSYLAENHGLTWPEIRKYIIFMPIIVVFVTVIATLLTPVFSRIEGVVFPVVSDMTFDAEPSGENWSEISGTFKKNRECAYLEADWFYSEDGLDVKVEIIYSKYNVRHKGLQVFKGWTLKVRPDQISNVHAYSYHQCHPFWATRTKIYP